MYVDLAEFDPDKVLATLDAASIAISEADCEGNPYGLFWHPDTEAESILVLCNDALLHQEAAACLVENMYIYCNNPAHIVVQTEARIPVRKDLAEVVADHLKPRHLGGYVAEYRPRATWTWACQGVSGGGEVIRSLERAGGTIEFWDKLKT